MSTVTKQLGGCQIKRPDGLLLPGRCHYTVERGAVMIHQCGSYKKAVGSIQNSAGLGSVNWSNVTDSIVDDGTNKMITQPMGTNRFLRLVLP